MKRKSVKQRLNAIENILRRKSQCLHCGFDHGIDDELFGQVGEMLVKHLRAKVASDTPEPGSVEKCLDPLKCCRHNPQSEYYIGKPEKRLVCNCVFKIDPDCKIHGGQNTFLKIPKSDKPFDIPLTLTDIAIREKKSALPLRVRVAKELGFRVWRTGYDDSQFRYNNSVNLEEGKCFPLVPRYDTDRDLALGAFWDYVGSLGLDAYGMIVFQNHGTGQIYINEYITNFNYIEFSEVPPDKLCEAIVKHSERVELLIKAQPGLIKCKLDGCDEIRKYRYLGVSFCDNHGNCFIPTSIRPKMLISAVKID